MRPFTPITTALIDHSRPMRHRPLPHRAPASPFPTPPATEPLPNATCPPRTASHQPALTPKCKHAFSPLATTTTGHPRPHAPTQTPPPPSPRLQQIKMNTKMSKVFDAYLQRKGLGPNTMKFMFDGSKIANDATPASLEMEDNDTIDAFLEQVGGGHAV